MRKYFKSIVLNLLIALSVSSCGSKNELRDQLESSNPSPVNPVIRWTRNVCSSWKDPINGNRIDYCIKSTDQSSSSRRTLFAFHGMGGSANAICDKLTADTLVFETIGNISHVICPSFGPHWVIHESGRTESFARFRTLVQQEYGIIADQHSVLYGESMGGFNVIKLSGSTNPDSLQFRKVVAACPALFSIRLPDRSLGSLLPSSVFGGFDLNTSLSIIQDSPYFDVTNRYPELLIMPNQNDSIGRAKFQISGMTLEGLGGIYQGAVDFHRALQQRGQPSQIQELPGEHCTGIPINHVIEYLGR